MTTVAELQLRALVELKELLYDTCSLNIPTQELYVKYPLWNYYTYLDEPCRILHLGLIDDVPMAYVVFPAFEHHTTKYFEHYVRADKLKLVPNWTAQQIDLLKICKMPKLFIHPLGAIKHQYPRVFNLIYDNKDVPVKDLPVPTRLREIDNINLEVSRARASPRLPVIDPSDKAQVDLHNNICTKTLYKDWLNETCECRCKVKH
jgi:hypothetical protein